MSRSTIVIVGIVVLTLAAGLGFFLAVRFPQHNEVATVARWIALISAPLLLVSLAIDRKKTK